MARLFLFSTALLFAALAVPTTTHAADKWISVRSRNFHLIGNASESSIRRIGRDLEEFRAGFALLFPVIDRQPSQPMTVIVFKDDKSFTPYKPLRDGKPANMAGFFQGGSDASFIALTADSRTPNVIYHEFVHSLTRDIIAWLPLWATEGLAEFYGTFEVASNGKEMLLGRPMVEHIQTLRESFLSVDTLFNVEHGSPFYNEQTKQGIFYAESWAVVHYLMLAENSKYQAQFRKFLSLLSERKPVDESFREAFQKEYPAFEKELRTYIGRFTFPAITYKLHNKIDFAREMQVSPLTDAQAEYYLGDLLLHMGRLDVAQTHLEKAAALDSGFTTTFAALGMLKLRQDKDEEALQFMARAAQDSKDHMTHYYYAALLQSVGEKSGRDADRNRHELMRQHLKKSIELSPAYLNAYDLLAYVALVLQEELPETQATLMKIVQAYPGRRESRLRLGELLIANNSHQAARVILLPLRGGADDDILDRAEELIDHINVFLESQRALLAYKERLKEAETPAAVVAGDEPLPDRPSLTRKPETSSAETIETATPRLDARPSGKEIQGALVSSDCSRGLTLRVRIGNGFVELHSNDPSKVEFVSYTTTVSDSFACGVLRRALSVRIVYRAGSDPRFLGEPLRVEFTDAK